MVIHMSDPTCTHSEDNVRVSSSGSGSDSEDTVDEARQILKGMSEHSGATDPPQSTMGGDPPEDPPAEDPPTVPGANESSNYEDDEIIEEEIMTDGEETIEEEIIEEEYTESSLRSKENVVQEIVDSSDAPPSPGASPPTTADAVATSPKTKPAVMDNDLAAFMERRRRAADGETLDEEQTQHRSNVDADSPPRDDPYAGAEEVRS